MNNHDPAIRLNATLIDTTNQQEWHTPLDCLPHPGDKIWIYTAPKGVTHVVIGITHRIGGGDHAVVIELDRLTQPT